MRHAASSDPHAEQRAELLAEIESEAAATATYTGRAVFSAAVMAVMAKVPRHRFVPLELEGAAYINAPLAIGFGQTISQPYIVALMTDLLDLHPASVVLEIGCGSGYQAAVLAELSARVYTVELVETLAETARSRLRDLGYGNVEVLSGDGYYGWAEHGPYDGILVTSAAPDIPPPLLEQLKPGGRLVIPIGLPYGSQNLVLVKKGTDGSIRRRSVLPVAFVPFRHEPEPPH